MMDSKKIIDLIIDYEDHIKKGNIILQDFYKINESPLLGRRKGQIPVNGKLEHKNMSFNFHGIGCTFEFGKIIADFDYTFGDFVYKGFEVSKLYTFIESCTNSSIGDLSEDSLRKSLKQMEKTGLLTKREPSSYDTYDYVLTSSASSPKNE